MTPCKLSIVIITFNEEYRLQRLLDELAAQSWMDFEIVHIDNNSDDATVRISRENTQRFLRLRIPIAG